MTTRPRKWWGWGYEDEAVDDGLIQRARSLVKFGLGIEPPEPIRPPSLEQLRLRSPRIDLPGSVSRFCTDDLFDRASHAVGKAYRDVVRALRAELTNPPDYVAYPREESEIRKIMAYCEAEQVALIPYGGGSSVVGGVEPATASRYRGTITVDLKCFDRIVEVDTLSRSARVQAGILGPALELGLRAHNLTLRHFPQSFEFSSLGGWIATRAGGHFATGFTHIDDFVESVRMVTPRGVLETRRVPYSGAGPSPERLVLGSEGILGVITEAWVRLQGIPTHRVSATVRFEPAHGISAVRALGQSGLLPSNCRLVSPLEALGMGAGDGSHAVLLLGFESHDHALEAWMERALEICAGFNGTWGAEDALLRDSAGETWRKSFLQAPYLRDYLVTLGLVVETFETAITWDRFDVFHASVLAAVDQAIRDVSGKGLVTWRLSYVYPDGVAPYYTVISTGRRGEELEQWAAIKAAASEAILANGGTITHHHAVGRDHRPWYVVERGELYCSLLSAAKASVDPHWIMNPGVLVNEPGIGAQSVGALD